MPVDNAIKISSFQGGNGDAEHFLAVRVSADLDFAGQLAEVERSYDSALKSLGLGAETAVFRRVYLSDILNQNEILHRSSLVAETAGNPVAVSVIQQPPLDGSKITLLAYHVKSAKPLVKLRVSDHHLLVEKNGLRHLWSVNLGSDKTDSALETRLLFAELVDVLGKHGGNLRDNCVRTWLYLKSIDIFYQGMVDARRELFAAHGLTGDTHYIASTGIEGAGLRQSALVAMDAYSVIGLRSKQVSFLNDLDKLCLTADYNVTFERGTRVAYADRAHCFISGTASIDGAGQVVHRGDIARQVGRTIDNIEALLRSGAASLADLKHLTVYLRDPADYRLVSAMLGERFPDLPMHIVHGAVCRPEWLVEIEGLAVARNDAAELPEF